MDRGPPRNEDIDLPEVRVLDDDKNPVGVMSSEEALEIAEEAGLDLVLMSPEAKPPVCRIMNYSKYKYEQEKKQRETRKRAKEMQVEIKELKMRYNIDTHDYGAGPAAVYYSTPPPPLLIQSRRLHSSVLFHRSPPVKHA